MHPSEYFFDMVARSAKRSNCVRKQVGSILVRNERIISKGWNGVATHADCRQAGCLWCAAEGPLGMGYDRCICTHAEQAAIGRAARKGIPTAGALIYTNLRPCMNCVKLTLASGIIGVLFAENWVYEDELEHRYRLLARRFQCFSQLEVHDDRFPE